MTKETQIDALNSMIFWAKQFAILREQWYAASGEEFADLSVRVASVAQYAIMHCEEAGLKPDVVLEQELFFLDTHEQRLKASA